MPCNEEFFNSCGGKYGLSEKYILSNGSFKITEWKDQKLNFIDTPGADDFVGGVISALNVADTAVMVVNAVRGVEVGTEIISRHAKRLNKPMIFIGS